MSKLKDEAIRLYQSGMTQLEVSEAIGLDTVQVSHYLRGEKLHKVGGPRKIKNTWMQSNMLLLSENGLTTQQIADIYNISLSSVHHSIRAAKADRD